jgi:cytochrome d ubiquinol oxidase subunit I
VQTQPMKMAATEALWNTEEPASFSILTIGDLAQRKDVFSIHIPRLLCLLAYDQLDCKVEGIYDLQADYVQQYGPGNYIPPVAISYWGFRAMVGAGTLMALMAVYALFMTMGEMFENRPRILRLYLLAIALPYLANTAGWLLTELGRAPWAVYGLMKIEDAVSPTVSGVEVLITLIGFTLIYGALMVADIYLLTKFARSGPSEDVAIETLGEDVPSLVGAQD